MHEAPRATSSVANGWPVWAGPLGLGIALFVTLLLTSVVAAIAVALGVDAPQDAPALTISGTLLQDVALVGTAVVFGLRYGQVRAEDFGLRPTSLRLAAVWTAVALLAFYALSALYAALVHPEGEQDLVDTLGVERGTGYLLATAFLVILVAPAAEEIFFRGFFYRSLRNRFSPLGAAAIVGAVFGAIHYTDADTLLLIPVLAALGAIFCLLYERTRSLYPAIAMHAINNALALASSTEAAGAVPVSIGFGVVALGACAAAPRAIHGRTRA